MRAMPPSVGHAQMEEGGSVDRVAERRPAQVFRIIVASACLLAAATVMSGQGKRVALAGEYAVDTEDNVFSRHYMTPAQRAYLAAHPPRPPPPPAAKAPAAPPPRPAAPTLPSLIGYSKREAKSFLQELPGMHAHEMDELIKAASFGHAPLVEPVIDKPRPLSAEAIAQERIRAEDVFSRSYGRPVQTTESDGAQRQEPDAELRTDRGEAADVMREAGKAFAMEEQSGNGKPTRAGAAEAARGGTRAKAGLAVPAFEYEAPDHTSQLAIGAHRRPARLDYRQQVLAAVPKIDSGLMSGLLDDEDQIDQMHIMSKARREDLNPAHTVNIDSEMLKRSINGLRSTSPASAGTDPDYGDHRHARNAGALNGDEGVADKAQQMAALRRVTQPKGTATESYAKALKTDSEWNKEMAAAVKASDAGVGGAIPIGDANSGDDSGAFNGAEHILQDEQKEIRTEKDEDKALLQDASPMWPSAKITRQEEEREAEEQRKLKESERRIALHDEKLRQDAEAAQRAKARAEREAEAAQEARRKAAAEQRREARVRRQQENSANFIRAVHQVPEATASRQGSSARKHEEEEQQWARAKQAVERKKAEEAKAQAQREAARKAAKEQQQQQWAAAEAQRKQEAERRMFARRQEARREDERASRERREREQEIMQEAHARQTRAEQEHQQVRQADSLAVRQPAAHDKAESDAQQAREIEEQVADLKAKLLAGAHKKESERKDLEQREAEDQASSSQHLRDLQALGNYMDGQNTASAPAPAPAPARVAVAAPVEPAARPPAAAPAPGQDPSWGNLISFMEGGGTPSKAPVAKAHYQAAQNAQALALSREDREAEKRAMEMAKQSAFQAEKFAHVSARQAVADVLGEKITTGSDGVDGDEGESVSPEHTKKVMTDSQFTKFMAHYKKTEAKEADYARRMRKRMADEKLDEQEVSKLRDEREKSDSDSSSSLLKVAEVLGSVGAGNILAGVMDSAKHALKPKQLTVGAGSALAKKAMSKVLARDPAAASGGLTVGTVWGKRPARK